MKQMINAILITSILVTSHLVSAQGRFDDTDIVHNQSPPATTAKTKVKPADPQPKSALILPAVQSSKNAVQPSAESHQPGSSSKNLQRSRGETTLGDI